jgi:predicted nucleic acid-binding protein
MILYLDTSTLVKLYVEEPDSQDVVDLVNASEVTSTSLIAYAEARAAFARRYREKAFKPHEYRTLVSSLNKDWDSYLTVRVSRDLVQLAGNLAEKHGLRGYDAIHLSSAITLRNELTTPIVFSSSDHKLQKAATLENLTQPESP